MCNKMWKNVYAVQVHMFLIIDSFCHPMKELQTVLDVCRSQ